MFSKMVILIPVYNPRERIINYVKKLKEKNYDVVVINDGSDENYHAVLKGWSMIVKSLIIHILKEKAML